MKKSVIAFVILFSVAFNLSAGNNEPVKKVTKVAKSSKNLSAVSLAVANNEIKSAYNYLSSGADVNVKHKTNGMTPLMYAARYNNVAMLQLLIANGADVDEVSKIGFNAKSYAEISNAKKAIAFLDSFINVQPLTVAIANGEHEKATKLINLGVNVNAKHKSNKMTPIMYAARHNNVPMIKLLIDNGANVNQLSKCGLSAIDYAKTSNAEEALKFLQSL